MKIIIKNKEQYNKALERLVEYKKAELKILNAQSYTIGANQLNRVNLARVQETISELEAAIDQYETYGTTGRRAGRIVPVD